jgi:hypothetical protein
MILQQPDPPIDIALVDGDFQSLIRKLKVSFGEHHIRE